MCLFPILKIIIKFNCFVLYSKSEICIEFSQYTLWCMFFFLIFTWWGVFNLLFSRGEACFAFYFHLVRHVFLYFHLVTHVLFLIFTWWGMFCFLFSSGEACFVFHFYLVRHVLFLIFTWWGMFYFYFHLVRHALFYIFTWWGMFFFLFLPGESCFVFFSPGEAYFIFTWWGIFYFHLVRHV